MPTDEQILNEQRTFRRQHGIANQLTMSGDDWLSDQDRKSQARAVAKRKRAGQDCAKKLKDAAEALNAYLHACRDCADGSDDKRMGQSDGRLILVGNIMEYASYLDGLYKNESQQQSNRRTNS